MRTFIFLQFIFIFSIQTNGQINVKDSTVQVVGYWDLNEKESFQVSYKKYRIKESDTTFVVVSNYDVDITIKDSTANSYEIEWFYKNYNIKSENKIIKRMSKIAENMSVIIKTDEFGAFVEVKNWKEIKEYIDNIINSWKKEFKDFQNIDKIIERTSIIYNSKEAIESNAIKDILQFYTFHGGQYLLNETLTGNLFVRNNYGGKPFDTKVEVTLDEINFENDNSVIRSYQVVDSEQVSDAAFKYINKLAEINHQEIRKKDIPKVSNQTWVASRIHGTTGWTTYSILTKEVSAENTTSVEETIIQLK